MKGNIILEGVVNFVAADFELISHSTLKRIGESFEVEDRLRVAVVVVLKRMGGRWYGGLCWSRPLRSHRV